MELSGAAFEGAAASELIRLSGNSAEKAVQNITFDGIYKNTQNLVQQQL